MIGDLDKVGTISELFLLFCLKADSAEVDLLRVKVRSFTVQLHG